MDYPSEEELEAMHGKWLESMTNDIFLKWFDDFLRQLEAGDGQKPV